MKSCIVVLFVCAVLGIAGVPCLAQPSATNNSTNQLKQHVAELQKSPDDQALREKIIKLALTLEPKPAVPLQTDEFIGAATYAFKNAKSEADFADAAESYKKALLLAPWVADYYFNLGIAQEKSGKLDEAIGSFNFYLMAAPEAKDAKEVRERVGGLKYVLEKKSKALAEQQQREQEAKAEQQRRDEAATAERQRHEQIISAQPAEARRIERAKEERRNAMSARYNGAVWESKVDSFGRKSVIFCDGQRLRTYTEFLRDTKFERKGRHWQTTLTDLADIANSEFTFDATSDDGNSKTRGKIVIRPDGKTLTGTYESGATVVYKRQK